MAPQSGTVTAGISVAQASQYNNLRADVLSVTLGHTHTGVSEDGKLIPTGGLANNAVTQAKCVYGIPAISYRQGGSATSWNTPGTVNYAMGTPVKEFDGEISVSIPITQAARYGTVSFPSAFAYPPIVLATPKSDYILNVAYSCFGVEISSGAAGFYYKVSRPYGMPTTFATTVTVHWTAKGPA